MVLHLTFFSTHSMRGALQASAAVLEANTDPDDVPHSLLNGLAMDQWRRAVPCVVA